MISCAHILPQLCLCVANRALSIHLISSSRRLVQFSNNKKLLDCVQVKFSASIRLFSITKFKSKDITSQKVVRRVEVQERVDSMATKHWLWLLIVVGGPCLLVLIFICTCLIMHRRARDLGVLPHRHYSFYVSGCVLPPPQSLGPITCRDPNSAGSQDNLIRSDPMTPRNSIHPSVPSSTSTFTNTVRVVSPDDQLLN